MITYKMIENGNSSEKSKDFVSKSGPSVTFIEDLNLTGQSLISQSEIVDEQFGWKSVTIRRFNDEYAIRVVLAMINDVGPDEIEII